MDIKNYISSGILELYALKQLSEQERIQVEEMMSKYPKIKTELDAIEKSIEEVAQSVAIDAPASLKMRILDRKKIQIPVQVQPTIQKTIQVQKTEGCFFG